MTRAQYEQDWHAVPDMLRLKITLWRYILLSKLTTGETRKRYGEKRTNLSDQIQKIENFYFKNTKQRMPFDWLFLKKQAELMIEPPMDGMNQSKREQEVIISLTTYPKRMGTVWIVLKAMLSQTYKPDKILLYLAEEQFPGHVLPDWAETYRKAGVEFVFCGDLKPHKKYYYAMQEYPEAVIITVDDDLIYDYDLIEVLMKSYLQFPHAISAMRTHKIAFDDEGHILPYLQWDHGCSKYIGEPIMRLLPTSGGGTLFPPHSLHPEVFCEENIRKCCLLADDLWLKVMAVLQGTPVVLAEETRPLNFIEGTQDTALWQSNVSKKGNDHQLKAILELYDSYHSENDTVKRRVMEG